MMNRRTFLTSLLALPVLALPIKPTPKAYHVANDPYEIGRVYSVNVAKLRERGLISLSTALEEIKVRAMIDYYDRAGAMRNKGYRYVTAPKFTFLPATPGTYDPLGKTAIFGWYADAYKTRP